MPATLEGKFPLLKRSPRVHKTLPITMREISAESAKKWAGAILDLSDHGLRVVTGKILHQGQEISVLQSETGMCFKRCRVIWTRPYRLSQLNEAGLRVLR
ncbi:MAG: PilZ domain-containing protein [Acidobacteria bacterium]|nr:PilZ domain-containing protein [Acidobacteriota bacterium]